MAVILFTYRDKLIKVKHKTKRQICLNIIIIFLFLLAILIFSTQHILQKCKPIHSLNNSLRFTQFMNFILIIFPIKERIERNDVLCKHNFKIIMDSIFIIFFGEIYGMAVFLNSK